MGIHRRQLLQALGLGAVANLLPDEQGAFAASPASPSRIVFYVQPHGHLPKAWTMGIPGGPTDRYAERSLLGLAPEDMSPTLRVLHPFRDRLLAIEGLSHTPALIDCREARKNHVDDNNHQVGVADVLTASRAFQRPGVYCTGGSRSLDQEIAIRTAAPGRFGSRVYGYDYTPNGFVSPFSYLGPGQAAPMVSNPQAAFEDLLGYTAPAASSGPKTREELLRSMRGSVLDSVSREYALLAPRLGKEGRLKLEQHGALVRDLERSLDAIGAVPKCEATFDNSGHEVRQFMRLIRLAFACDLTRVVTFSAPVPACPELGYPATTTFHTYAHGSIEGATSCGAPYEPIAEQAMIDLDAWHAAHVAYLLGQLDSVAEGNGTMLDHTVVVWVTELATPTHNHQDACILLAGGCNGAFKTGRYVRYPRTFVNPVAAFPMTGPPHNRLHVSLLNAMGQPDTSFGLTEGIASDGSPITFTGRLTELHT